MHSAVAFASRRVRNIARPKARRSLKQVEGHDSAVYIYCMTVELPDLLQAKLSAHELRLDLAVGMYSSGRVTIGTAAEIADLSVPEFQRELGRRRIPANYTAQDLTYDLKAAAELGNR